MILRAQAVFPVTAPPIEDGAVFVDGRKITAVGPWRQLHPAARARALDLGEVVLLPGLVNAHCHLDYTDMAGALPPPRTFTDWIPGIMAHKSGWSYSDYAHSWLRGANQLLQTGTTTVADIEVMPDLLPEVWEATPLRVFSFLEMTGIKSRRQPREILSEAVQKIEPLRHPRHRAFLSPHAPYSTVPELLQLAARTSRRRKWPVSIHVAESAPEFEMFAHARGPMYDWLKRNERDNSDCGKGSPLAHLARHQLLSENVLAIHVNYLARGDATLLAKNKTHVVHCPRSHDYFKHAPFARARLAKAGVNICLGTDSLASVRKLGRRQPELDMFAEMRALGDRDKALSPSEIIRMATVNGARALGLSGKIGELVPGALADLIALPLPGSHAHLPETILAHHGPVAASLIAGSWGISPH